MGTKSDSRAAARPDVFAAIARSGADTGRVALVESAPPVLPARQLPASRTNARAVFRPQPKLDTPGKLQRALARERRRLAPFLRDLAPPVASARSVTRVSACDWGLE
ncbi:MAG: hypothetical protein K9N49_09900, partial [Candidatus Marinimicrobia bacterium]|nr:hypothetical protein [Candidatus Neomarinimicrobiota bacterium]